ncbi:MAG TPA: putative glycolipid-binding domain-containing protein [Gemmatimonadales bacterium]
MVAPPPILWRRLDLPGHDAAALRASPGGVVLSGMAVFHEGETTALAYAVHCNLAWQTTEATVGGWRGPEPVTLRLRRDAGGSWTLNDVPCPGVQGCIDLDLSFTPATNLLPLRRLALERGQSAEVRSAWLEWPQVRLTPLAQRYARRTETEYDYEADLPGGTPFRAILRVQPGGWVLDYGGLWQADGGLSR